MVFLGGWLPTFMSPIREHYEIKGAYWFYTGTTLAGLAVLFIMLNKRTVEKAIADAKAESQQQAQRLGVHDPLQYLRGKVPSLWQRLFP